MSKGQETQFILSEWLRSKAQWLIIPIAQALAKWGVSPNALTLLGFLLTWPVAWALSAGRSPLAGALLILASSFDALDGSLARYSAQSTRFGAFWDSVMDRLSESVVFLGLGLLALRSQQNTQLLLVYASVVGSLLVSYVRARAENIGVDCRVGFFTRFERMTFLALCLLLKQPGLALWGMAILSNLTVIQRIHYVWRATRGDL